ncbi:hypothetical protein NIES4101_62940 [Calothrix sp. NIES-4101]|nr:hypothetical protein NIES4101_62940 [Calothrix sp. NIES-4101]
MNTKYLFGFLATLGMMVPSFIGILHSEPAVSLCTSPKEAGRWTSIDPKGDPYIIEINMTDCGDQVLNGVQTQTRYAVKVSVKQSSGALYQRSQVEGRLVNSGGKRWLFAKVPTGGYVDNMWMRTETVAGKTQLYVSILHKSLDSKPDARSRFWYSK